MAKTIIELPIVYKYIAQRQWRKLCILFRLYPELLSYHNYGYYMVYYKVDFKKRSDFDYFLVDMFKIGLAATDHFCKILGTKNEVMVNGPWHYDVPISIKKRDLTFHVETVIKKYILENYGRLTILNEFRI